ncbi:hypothetical protein [Methylococcus mesophilus]|uniref:hypothetical protein n=1 Tax=Methylococcus mesophilus TaxID=2993564 RepID=UPI00224B855A|nr:hypothetical protein [Methylococcus mesophilus]UZR30746.1 hypothetical protein OOT43_09005 [Methylococcus mesophilus]
MPRKSQGRITGRPVTTTIPSPADGVRLETFLPWTLVKRGVKREVITPLGTPAAFREEARQEVEKRRAEQDTPLIRALGLAHFWQRLLDEGKFESLSEIANAEGLDLSQASRVGRLVQLAPEIVEACLAGKGGGRVSESRCRSPFSLDWQAQRVEILARPD